MLPATVMENKTMKRAHPERDLEEFSLKSWSREVPRNYTLSKIKTEFSHPILRNGNYIHFKRISKNARSLCRFTFLALKFKAIGNIINTMRQKSSHPTLSELQDKPWEHGVWKVSASAWHTHHKRLHGVHLKINMFCSISH